MYTCRNHRTHREDKYKTKTETKTKTNTKTKRRTAEHRKVEYSHAGISTKQPDTLATNSVDPLKDGHHIMNRQVPF